MGKLLAPTIPLPEGDRIVLIETQNTLTNAPEPRVVRDFLEWRRELRTIEDLGAYRTDTRNLLVGNAAPEPIQMAELTAAAFRTARVPPLLGRALLDSDEVPGAPSVVVLGYDVWQRSLGGRHDVVGSVVKLGNTPATVIGVMPDGFRYPSTTTPGRRCRSAPRTVRSRAARSTSSAGWLLASRGSRRTRSCAWSAERAAAALPATHEHLRPRVMRLGEAADDPDGFAQFAMRNLPVLLVLIIACMNVGTLFYARTATREGEIAVRSALGASRARIIGQLFVEALVLASIAAAVGLVAADRALTWGIERGRQGRRRALLDDAGPGAHDDPVCQWPRGRQRGDVVAAAGAESHAGARAVAPGEPGTGGATLRFGRVWTGAMIAQVALTAMGIPVAMESASRGDAQPEHPRGVSKSRVSRGPHRCGPAVRRGSHAGVRGAAGSDVRGARAADRAGTRRDCGHVRRPRARVRAEISSRQRSSLARRRAGVRCLVLDSRRWARDSSRHSSVQSSPGVRSTGRPESRVRERSSSTRRSRATFRATREADRRSALASGIPRHPRQRTDASAAEPWFEIVGVVRDFGLDPDDEGDEQPFVFHAASAGTVSPLVMSVRVRGNPATLVARLPVIAADVDAGLYVQRRAAAGRMDPAAGYELDMAGRSAGGGDLARLVSVGDGNLLADVRQRLAADARNRAAHGARRQPAPCARRNPVTRHGAHGERNHRGRRPSAAGRRARIGPTGRPADDVVLFAGYLGVTAAVMLAACLLACIEPARRAVRINPTDALREG